MRRERLTYRAEHSTVHLAVKEHAGVDKGRRADRCGVRSPHRILSCSAETAARREPGSSGRRTAGYRLPDHVDPSSGRACQEDGHHLSRRQSARSYADWMKHARPVAEAAVSLAVWPLAIILSPVILVAGEPVNRYVMRRVRLRAAGPAAVIRHGDRPARAVAVRLPAPASLLLVVISNPLWIALTAPGRWVSDRFRRPPSVRAGTAAR